MTMGVWAFLSQPDQVKLQQSSQRSTCPDTDAVTLPPHLAGSGPLDSVAPHEVVRPLACFIEILERPGVGRSSCRGGRVRQCPEEADPGFAGPVVLGPSAG